MAQAGEEVRETSPEALPHVATPIRNRRNPAQFAGFSQVTVAVAALEAPPPAAMGTPGNRIRILRKLSVAPLARHRRRRSRSRSCSLSQRRSASRFRFSARRFAYMNQHPRAVTSASEPTDRPRFGRVDSRLRELLVRPRTAGQVGGPQLLELEPDARGQLRPKLLLDDLRQGSHQAEQKPSPRLAVARPGAGEPTSSTGTPHAASTDRSARLESSTRGAGGFAPSRSAPVVPLRLPAIVLPGRYRLDRERLPFRPRNVLA